jgi:hypothetical protein
LSATTQRSHESDQSQLAIGDFKLPEKSEQKGQQNQNYSSHLIKIQMSTSNNFINQGITIVKEAIRV